MNGETHDDGRVALLERHVSELDDRLRSIEAWSVEMYQYQYYIRPNPALNPPAPRWQRQVTPSFQPATAPLAPPPPKFGQPLIMPPVIVPPYGPFVPPALQDASQPSVAPLWRPVMGMVERLRGPVAAAGDTVSAAPPTAMPPGTPTVEAGTYQPAPPAQRRQRQWSFSDFEQLLSGRGLAWVGGLAILLGALFFLGLAFTRGWIGPAGRVGIGLVAGLALIAGGAWFFERREALFGHVLLAVGLGTTSMSLVAATRLYHLFPIELALAGALIVGVAAAVIAIRADSQVIAAYGLVTALAAPPLLGASPNLTTIAFLAAALIGTTVIALYRTWNWLPTIAFLLSAPQLAAWLLDDAPLALGLVALAGFWAVNTVAAGGEEFRVRRDRLSATSATLLLATAAFLLSVGFGLLSRHDASDANGLFLLVMALAYGAVGAYFLRAEGQNHGFGLLATGTGIAALTMAIPIQFGGPVVPIAWAAEGAALAWVYTRRQHRFSGIASVVLGALAVLHLVFVEYPLYYLFISSQHTYGTVPFIDPEGLALAFLLLAFAVAASFVRVRAVRAALAFVGMGLVAYAMPFVTADNALLTGWATLFVLIVSLERVTPLVERRFPSLAAARGSADLGRWLCGVSAAGVAALALLQTYTRIFADPFAAVRSLPATPFVDQRTLATAILIAASLLAAALTNERIVRRVAIIAPFAFAAVLLPTEVNPAATVVGWSALSVLLYVIERWDMAGKFAYRGAVATFLAVAFAAALADVAPLTRLAVHASATVNHPLFYSGATAALGSVIVALACIGWQYRREQVAPWLFGAAGAIAVYLLSVGIVDEFQRHVTAGTTHASLVNLQKQAQVTLSIFWALLGGAAFVLGIVRRFVAVRIGGLALLGIATVKVFIFDLASLDATYKVPSLIGLGILLLASSYVYQRVKPRDAEVRPVIGQ